MPCVLMLIAVKNYKTMSLQSKVHVCVTVSSYPPPKLEIVSPKPFSKTLLSHPRLLGLTFIPFSKWLNNKNYDSQYF